MQNIEAGLTSYEEALKTGIEHDQNVEVLKERILQPLGLKNTGMTYLHDIIKNLATMDIASG
jgi:hypothetical protein